MTYYILMGESAIIANVMDDRSAEFKAKIGWDDDVERVESEMELLRSLDVPLYTKNRLRYFFPEIREISEEEYQNAVASIDKFNEEQKKLTEEVNSVSLSDIQNYLALLPSSKPEIISYAELRNISRVLAAANQDVDSIDGAVEATEDTVRLIYSVVLGAERSGDRSVIEVLNNAASLDESTSFSLSSVEDVNDDTEL